MVTPEWPPWGGLVTTVPVAHRGNNGRSGPWKPADLYRAKAARCEDRAKNERAQKRTGMAADIGASLSSPSDRS
jgi:hypothetical protein